ncbi:MAG: hypothetical protein IPK19_06725 [Chloroflexi bacterium]|nr:hypothetical protein [Chloroflexota bacterium]
MGNFWKSDWDGVRARHIAWWEHRGFVVSTQAPADNPHANIPKPATPETLEQEWITPEYRARKAEYDLSRTYFGGEAYPYYDTHIGPGSLALMLGSHPSFTDDSVWYHPCFDDLENAPSLLFDPNQLWFQRQRALLEHGMAISDGRFLVGMPDLIENMDTVASLRGAESLMFDLIEQPDVVKRLIAEINQVYFDVFDALYQIIRDEWGGNAFSAFRIWGPGKTGKVQCDASAMFSPKMFAEFVAPSLSEQCAWLDYSMYHLDGTQAVVHLDQLLAIESLHAIEWTPQAGIESGGDPRWYPLYRRILDAGKSVQAVGVLPEEVLPLLDATGGTGMFIIADAQTEAEARSLIESVERRR